jgi:hypothetical protein
MTYYDEFNLLTTASDAEILHAYGENLLRCSFLPSKSPEGYQLLQATQHAYGVLSHRRTRDQYNALIHKAPYKTDPITMDWLDYFVELHKLQWRCFFLFPVGLRVTKILAELLSRILMSAVGAAVGIVLAIRSYSDILQTGTTPSGIESVPGSIKLAMVVCAIAFLFYKELFRLFRRNH